MKPLKAPIGWKLANEIAVMMGLKLEKTYSVNDDGCMRYSGKVVSSHDEIWKPHIDYNQCRIVEDWIWEKGLWEDFMDYLEVAEYHESMRSTPLQRCQSAWLAWKENKYLPAYKTSTANGMDITRL